MKRPSNPTNEPIRVIFDTDPGGDVDDAGALAVLHALADRGEVEIIAMGASNGHPLTVSYIQAVNAWFGRPKIPVGQAPPPGAYQADRFMEVTIGRGPHALTHDDAPEAADLYREVLAACPDRSVTIVAVGPATNIARLLQSRSCDPGGPCGVELVRRKVAFYAAGGNGNGGLPDGRAGFNYHMDNSAARVELALVPEEIPMVYAGGSGTSLPLGECYRDAPAGSIVRRSYEAYFRDKPSLDRPTWDQLRVLYGCRSDARRYFETSPPGDIGLDPDHRIRWTASPDRNRAYAYVQDADAVRSILTELMMHQPARR